MALADLITDTSGELVSLLNEWGWAGPNVTEERIHVGMPEPLPDSDFPIAVIRPQPTQSEQITMGAGDALGKFKQLDVIDVYVLFGPKDMPEKEAIEKYYLTAAGDLRSLPALFRQSFSGLSNWAPGVGVIASGLDPEAHTHNLADYRELNQYPQAVWRLWSMSVLAGDASGI